MRKKNNVCFGRKTHSPSPSINWSAPVMLLTLSLFPSSASGVKDLLPHYFVSVVVCVCVVWGVARIKTFSFVILGLIKINVLLLLLKPSMVLILLKCTTQHGCYLQINVNSFHFFSFSSLFYTHVYFAHNSHRTVVHTYTVHVKWSQIRTRPVVHHSSPYPIIINILRQLH